MANLVFGLIGRDLAYGARVSQETRRVVAEAMGIDPSILIAFTLDMNVGAVPTLSLELLAPTNVITALKNYEPPPRQR